MRIGVEKAVLVDLLDHRAEGQLRDGFAVVALSYRFVDLVAIEEAQRDDLFGRGLTVDCRKDDLLALGKILAKTPRIFGFLYEVEFGGDGLVKLVDEADWRVDLGLGYGSFEERRQGMEDVEIA